MKAIVYTQYGSPDVLQFKDVEKPVPTDDEVLIKVVAASVNAADWRLVRAEPFLVRLYAGLFKPGNTALGCDVAGRVEAVGKNVTQFQPGDEIFGDLFYSGRGGFAEYVCAREDALVLKPAGMTFEEAAAVPLAGVTALQGLRNKRPIQPGQQVLIYGAGGGVGLFAVQIAKTFGAEVTAVCSTGMLETVHSLGADHLIDYTKEDFAKSGHQYDFILAVNGNQPIAVYQRALHPGGIYVMIGGAGAQFFQTLLLGPWISMTSDKTMGNLTAKANSKDLAFLKGLIEEGKLKSVIDRRYPLSELADAIRYVEKGHAQGKVIITIA